MNVLSRRLGVVVAAAAGACAMAADARAQSFAVGPGACCLPDQTCTVMSAFDCGEAGGVFAGFYTLCINSNDCPQGNLGIGMSRSAAKRLLQEGVIHTLWTAGDPLLLNNSTATPIENLWNLAANGVLIAPHIYLDVREDPDPELAAQEVIDRVYAAKVD